jgi:hypothetical protein
MSRILAIGLPNSGTPKGGAIARVQLVQRMLDLWVILHG